MTNIFIAGELGKIVGSSWKLKVRNFAELFNAIEANVGKLRKYLAGRGRHKLAIFVNGDLVNADNFLRQDIRGSKVEIIPVLAGGAAAMAAWIVTDLLVMEGLAAVIVEFVLTAIISAAISFGISLLINKLLKPDDPDATKTSSFVFSSAENVTQQGQVVPVGYGRMLIGSSVISTTLSNVDKSKWVEEEEQTSDQLSEAQAARKATEGAIISAMWGVPQDKLADLEG